MSAKYIRHNNMPIQSPLIPDPFVPYNCPDNTMAYVICRGEEDKIRDLLEPTYFNYMSDIYMVAITDFSKTDKVSFMDAAIIVPVKYKDIFGGYYLFEYENNDRAIAAGRDLWGYPKKFAHISLIEEDDCLVGQAIRNGVTSCKIRLFEKEKLKNELPNIKITPNLNMHVLPRSDGPGIFMTRVIARDTSPDFELKKHVQCCAEIELIGTEEDPWDGLGLMEVVGGGIIYGDYHATEKNGWGKVLSVFY